MRLSAAKSWVGKAYKLPSFADRIRAACAQVAIPPKAPALMKAWEAKFGKDLTPSRQAFYVWMRSDEPKITPPHLYKLADLLQVNARWLAINEGTPTRPIFPTVDEVELWQIFNKLTPTGKATVLKSAQDEWSKHEEISALIRKSNTP